MADDIDDLLNCIEKKMNTKVKSWDSEFLDDDDGVKSPPAKCQSQNNKNTSDKCLKK